MGENLHQTLQNPLKQNQGLGLSIGAKELLGAALMACLQQVRRLLDENGHKGSEEAF